ncbi:MAG: helix-turn-helix domain-containing protein [Acidimicrobiia bacterium]
MARADGASTRADLLEAAARVISDRGYSGLSTRLVAETADVPLSQIHYHFGSKLQLVLAVLEEQNRVLLERQMAMYSSDMPLWEQWDQACDFLEEDLRSGYVRLLQEMIAAGWSDDQIASTVRTQLEGWHALLTDVAGRASERVGAFGLFTAEEFAALAASAFLGAEQMILLGLGEATVPVRSALRTIGRLLRRVEEGDHEGSPSSVLG